MDRFILQNEEAYACPTTKKPLRWLEEKQALCCEDTGKVYPLNDGILFLLPDKTENFQVKEEEKEGWRKIFESNNWRLTGDGIRSLPVGGEGDYWRKVEISFPFTLKALGDLKGKRGADLASGLGWAAYKFSMAGAKVSAVDYNPTEYNGLGAARLAIDEQGCFDCICCDGEELPFLNSSLDFVFTCSALHHFTRPERTLQEIHRVLKSGGLVIAICEAFRTGFYDNQRASKHEQLVEFRQAGINEHSYLQSEYNHFFRSAGFERLHTFFPSFDNPIAELPMQHWYFSDLVKTQKLPRSLWKRLFWPLIFRTPLKHLYRRFLLSFSSRDRALIARKS